MELPAGPRRRKTYFENLRFATFVILFPKYHLQIKVNKNIQKCFCVLFIGWYTHHLYSWQSFSLYTRPQKIPTSAYCNKLRFRVCHQLRLLKCDIYFQVTLDHLRSEQLFVRPLDVRIKFLPEVSKPTLSL